MIVAVYAIRGIFRGAVRQCFGFLGTLLGLWAALWILQWVGRHWAGARPAFIFGLLKWIVAGLGGIAIASLIQFWGDALGASVQKTGAAAADRAMGSVLGATGGAIAITLVLMLALTTRWPASLPHTAARSRFAVPLMTAGAWATSVNDSVFPGSAWLKRKFLDAERRARDRSSSS